MIFIAGQFFRHTALGTKSFTLSACGILIPAKKKIFPPLEWIEDFL
jgi:hypothetical protein